MTQLQCSIPSQPFQINHTSRLDEASLEETLLMQAVHSNRTSPAISDSCRPTTPEAPSKGQPHLVEI